jgi:hypothetical protein
MGLSRAALIDYGLDRTYTSKRRRRAGGKRGGADERYTELKVKNKRRERGKGVRRDGTREREQRIEKGAFIFLMSAN